MKKLNCALLVTLSLTSSLAMAKKRIPLDIKKAQANVRLSAKENKKDLQEKLKTIQKLVAPTYSQMKKIGGKRMTLLLENAQKIRADKYLSAQEKKDLLTELVQKNEKLIKASWSKVSFKNSSYEKLLKKTFPESKISFHEVGSVSMEAYPQVEDPAVPDYSFTTPYSYPFEFEDHAGVSDFVSSEAETNLDQGEAKSSIFTMWIPYSHAVAGVSERLTLPPSVHSIRVTANVFVKNASAYSIGMLGFGYATSSLFLEIQGNNTTLCKENSELVSSMAPVLWIHLTNSRQVRSITCTANVVNNRNLVITAGGESFGMAILNSGVSASNNNFIESIDVEVIH